MNTSYGTTPDRVKVYAFMEVEEGVELGRLAPFKARREDILDRYAGVVLEGTAQEVELESLDEQGRLLRPVSVWGDL